MRVIERCETHQEEEQLAPGTRPEPCGVCRLCGQHVEDGSTCGCGGIWCIDIEED
jgi:hypothetical protein